MSMAKIITVQRTSDYIEEDTFYELYGDFLSIENKSYKADVTTEEHFEKTSYHLPDFFRKLFNEVERAIRHCKSRKMEDLTVWYDFFKKAIKFYVECMNAYDFAEEDLPEIPEILVEYINNLSFMDWEIKDGRILNMGVCVN